MPPDDVLLNAGTGGDTIAADLISGVKHQRVKVQYGADGSATDVDADSPLPITFGNQATSDAFGRFRVSEPHTIFESKLLGLDDAPLLWDEQLESGGGITASTPTADVPFIDFASTLSTAGVFTRQTRRRFPYQPGKSQLVLMTGVLDLLGGGTGAERRIGLFDDNNGVFFEDDAGTIGVTIRSSVSGSVVDTTVTQANWNLDKHDGTGPSGITAAWTAAQIFVIDYQWLSVGRVRFGLEHGGHIHYVHQFTSSNISAVPYMSTPNLPLRYQMITTGSSLASQMRCICSVVVSEGGQDPVGAQHGFGTTAHVDANVADTIYAVVGLRLKSTHLGCDLQVNTISMLSETNDDFEWRLYFNPTVAGTFTYSNLTNSCVQTAAGATANTITNGTILACGFANSQSGVPQVDFNSIIRLGALIDGTVDELVLCVRPLGTNADIQGSLSWSEHL